MPGRRKNFESLRASELYCKKCGRSMPVRERLLLVLPDKEIYDYLCIGCSESLGQRELSSGDFNKGASDGGRLIRPF